MNVETQRKNIVHRILDVSNSRLLSKIEALLDDEIYTYTTSGKPLSVKEYENHLNQIMIASDSGEKGYTTEEARSNIVRK
ncbi:hypothetical protein [Flavobacterium gawalongense]|uniref:Uncharacterized protein n=1 Tax=Flavobacterium gawalongense TaxID=2594432 RepID=A0A553BTT2_9FLAO|nr:hypothetical protein [Flavobacterium gawalongense]TRX02247.1 hypothetical protein FNW33_07180 [Flavobacterium gawalongense]TRX07476.1 hypothetical protein FNW12_06485 [Flavobacterium gawalongense]TRX11649.1 hypothetical protein FNW11_05540 [Flavobacterium gawalongense]TRX12348.1 hypothetical protein FNW10_04350 [Flavobacterium gawalongense]TRX30387.1 hypothetical protein FNW38_04805 [Flavobacterium gawalongense]